MGRLSGNRQDPLSSHRKSLWRPLRYIPNGSSGNPSHLPSNHSPYRGPVHLSEGRSQTAIPLRSTRAGAMKSATKVLRSDSPRRKASQTIPRKKRQTKILLRSTRTSTRTTNLHRPDYAPGGGGASGILCGSSLGSTCRWACHQASLNRRVELIR